MVRQFRVNSAKTFRMNKESGLIFQPIENLSGKKVKAKQPYFKSILTCDSDSSDKREVNGALIYPLHSPPMILFKGI